MFEELMHSNLKAKEIIKIMKLQHTNEMKYLKESQKQEKLRINHLHVLDKRMEKFHNKLYLETMRKIKKEQLDKVMGYE